MKRLTYLSSCLLIGLLALFLAFGLPQALRITAWRELSVPWCGLLLLAWTSTMAFVGARWRQDSHQLNRGRVLDLAVAVGLTALLLAVIPGRAFIENDESNMLATALSIRHDWSPVSAVHGVYLRDGSLLVLAEAMDKRGVMFPLMIALVNMVAGDHPVHAIWLNALWTCSTLLLSARLARRFLPGDLGCFAPVLLTSFGAFSITARGATFDVANAFFLFLLVHLAAGLIRAPTAMRALLSGLTGAIVALLRYETLLLAGLATLLVLAIGAFGSGDRRRFWIAPGLPLLLVPATWRLAVPINWEMPGPWFVPWAARNAPDNLERLAVWLWSPAHIETGNPVIGILALVGFIAGFIKLLALRRWPILQAQHMVAVVAIILLITIYMLSYWGQATLLITVRYFIPVALAAAILALHGFQHMTTALSTRPQHLLVAVGALLLLGWQLPRLREAKPFAAQLLPQYRDQLLLGLEQAYGSCNTLVLSPHSTLLLARARSAMTPLAYETLGIGRLQQMSNASIDAVVFPIPLYNGAPDLPAEELSRWATGSIVHEVQFGARGIRLLQTWPGSPVSLHKCQPRPALSHFLEAPDFKPPRVWEQMPFGTTQ